MSRLEQIPGEVSFNGIHGVGAQIAIALDGRTIVGVSSQPGQSSLQLLDADTSRVLQQVPANVVVGWALAPDRKVVVAAAGSIAAPSSDVLIWRVGTAAPDVRRVPAGGKPIRIAMCGADIACVLTDRQLVRVRLSDATVERRLPLPRDTVEAQETETPNGSSEAPTAGCSRSSLSTGGCASWTLGPVSWCENSRVHPATCTRWRSHRTGAGSSRQIMRAC